MGLYIALLGCPSVGANTDWGIRLFIGVGHWSGVSFGREKLTALVVRSERLNAHLDAGM